MKERRNRQHEFRIEGVYPGKGRERVRFVSAVAKIQAGILSSELAVDQIVLDVVGIRIVGNLIVIPAQRSHDAQLVGRINIKDEGDEAAETIFGVVNHLWNRGLDAEIATVKVDAGIVSESLGVAAEAESIVSLVEISCAEHQFSLAVAFKASAGSYIEHSVGAVADLGAVASAIDLEIVDIFGIDLRAQIGSDVGVGYGDAVDEPAGLVAAADVELIMGDVGSGDVVGNHSQAVGASRAGSAFDIETADQSGGRSRVCGCGFGVSGNIHGDFVGGDA